MQAADRDRGLFDGGPPLGLEERLGLTRPDQPRVTRRAVLAALAGWLPLAALTAADPDARALFLSDFGVHARALITVPFLILAEGVLAPRMGAIAQHFLDAGLVADADRGRFDAVQCSLLRLRDAVAAEALVILLSFAIVIGLITSPAVEFPAWHETGAGRLSAAGWWHGLVSLPLLIVLFLGWMWRLFLWTRFLWLVSRLDLKLIPAHPDHAAGLMFVTYSVRASSVLGFALGAVVAGTAANGVAHKGVSPLAYQYAVIGLVLFVLAIFVGPLLIFSGQLSRHWRRGVFEYGALAGGLGRQFEGKWLGRRAGEEVLEVPDFSAATDLYQTVSNVYGMHLVAVDRKSVFLLAIATLLPFVPVVLMAVPLDTLFADVANLLF